LPEPKDREEELRAEILIFPVLFKEIAPPLLTLLLPNAVE